MAAWARVLLLSAGASVLCFNGRASAIETITFKYRSPETGQYSQVDITLNEIEEFANTGTLPTNVQQFFDLNTQSAPRVREVLTTEIRIPGDVLSDARKFIDSSTGEFVVLELDKLIQGSSDLQDLRAALRESIADDRNISILEVLKNYSGDSVTLDLTGLVRAYTDVKAFVERILPALEVAKQYLQDIICDCPQPTGESSSSPQSALPDGTSYASNCQSPRTATQRDVAPAANLPLIHTGDTAQMTQAARPTVSQPHP